MTAVGRGVIKLAASVSLSRDRPKNLATVPQLRLAPLLKPRMLEEEQSTFLHSFTWTLLPCLFTTDHTYYVLRDQCVLTAQSHDDVSALAQTMQKNAHILLRHGNPEGDIGLLISGTIYSTMPTPTYNE